MLRSEECTWRGLLLMAALGCALLDTGVAQLSVRSVASDRIFADPSNIRVGLTSDLTIQVQCVSDAGTGTGPVTWRYQNGTEVSQGLRAFGVSQGGEGVLRVNPARELGGGEGNQFSCSNGTSEQAVMFKLVDDLFFPGGPPLVVDIPEVNITMVTEGDTFFYTAEGERGVYRSASVSCPTTFRYEPVNITVRPINGFSTAAFSCSIHNPDNTPVSFQWEVGSANGSIPLNETPDLVTTWSDFRTSVLILQSVSFVNEGSYFCRVECCCSSFNSSDGVLTYNETADGVEPQIILFPDHVPSGTTIPSGVPFTIPCVTSDLSVTIAEPSGDTVLSQNDSTIGTRLVIQERGNIGALFVVCGTRAFNFLVIDNVLEVVSLETTVGGVSVMDGAQEVVAVEGLSLQLSCPGNQNRIVVNNVTAGNSSSLEVESVERNQSGYYQCLSERERAIDSVYLLVTYVDTPKITLTTQTPPYAPDSALTLSCSSLGRPAPRLSWSVDPPAPYQAAQTPTGSGEAAESNISLNTSSLAVSRYTITCTAEVDADTGSPLTSSATYNFTVLFQDIFANSSVDSFEIGDPNVPISVFCSVRASITPSIMFSKAGEAAITGSAVMSVGLVHHSTLTIDSSTLTLGTKMISCFAQLPVSILTREIAIVSISVNGLFGVVVSPEALTVNTTLPLLPSGGSGSGAAGGDPGRRTLVCSLMANPSPLITWTRDDGEALGNTSATRSSVVPTEFESELVVELSEVRGVVTFTCVASLEVTGANVSATSTITHNISPRFTVDPSPLTVVVDGDGDRVTLNCTAQGYPAPSITWESEEGDPLSSTFNITLDHLSSSSVLSSLSFVASLGDLKNSSFFHCVATNGIGNGTESGLGQLQFAGPPDQPGGLEATNIEARSVVLNWSRPFSLVPLTKYLLKIQAIPPRDVPDKMLDPQLLTYQVPDLRPFTTYRAFLMAFSDAGEGVAAEVDFKTAEAAPGPPTNVRTSAPSLGIIIVTWQAPPLEERNGDLTQYTVLFGFVNNQTIGTIGTIADVSVGEPELNMSDLSPGVQYFVQVAAHTRAGRGNFSDPVNQSTVALPPALGDVRGFQVDPTRDVTPSTIPITLPVIADPMSFSHFWVIAMKLGTAPLPLDLFRDNASFVLYSSDVVAMEPYVTAEISMSRYDATRTYLLGSLESNVGLNDNAKYLNGPLNQSTTYTVLVWGFSPVPLDGSSGQRAKRQSTPVRQYGAFSSTPFLTPITTSAEAIPGGLSGGSIAGLVIGLVIALLLLVAIVILAVFLYDRYKYQSEIGPPPSRKGSMRLRDNEVHARSSLRSSLRSSFRAITLRNEKAEAELQDLNPDDARLPVPVHEFADYAKAMHKNTDHLFSEEYEIVSIKSPSLSHIQCSQPGNIAKNRYANINCYDSSRVILSTTKDANSDDFINANYIDGYKVRCAYIATQGPLANTTHDFWRMVWEQESSCIIMLTNLVEKSRVKCHQYWPEVGSMSMGDMTIMLVEVQELAYYTIRTLRLTKREEMREVKQFHYTGWPDFGVPDYPHPVLAFIKRLARYHRSTEGPDVMHCSAGVGRTGTLVGIQAMIDMAREEEMLDVFNFVLGMRHQRNYMVQTERQYIFIHDTLLEHLRMGDTEITMQSLRSRYKALQAHDPKTDSSKLEVEYRRLNELEEVDKFQYQPGQTSINLLKNRFPTILPYDRYRVRLLLHPGVSGSDYINASYVDGYQRRHQYILTQGPMSNTVTDFWRMVWEHRCSCIMMLCQCTEKGVEQSVCYWPTDKVRQHGDMFIEQTTVTQHPSYIMREFAITNTKINESRVVKHFQYSDWLETQAPPTAAAIIDLIGVIQKTQHTGGGGPIIVHDSTSIGRSGAFVVLSSMLEQLKVEGVIDPFSTIHSLRQQQPGIVNAFEQYTFCYQAVIEFLDSFDHYSNFN